jgi:hypothetical protein
MLEHQAATEVLRYPRCRDEGVFENSNHPLRDGELAIEPLRSNPKRRSF